MAIDVYTAPNCMGCFASMRVLDKHGIPYSVIDVSEDRDAMFFIKGLGHHQAPVIVTSGGDHWSGHNPGKLKGLVDAHAALAVA